MFNFWGQWWAGPSVREQALELECLEMEGILMYANQQLEELKTETAIQKKKCRLAEEQTLALNDELAQIKKKLYQTELRLKGLHFSELDPTKKIKDQQSGSLH